MTKPIDYLAAAAVLEMKRRNFDTFGELVEQVEQRFDLSLTTEQMLHAFRHLESFGLVEIIKDDYAGELAVIPHNVTLQIRLGNLDEGSDHTGLFHALQREGAILKTVFKNEKFWADLNADLENDDVPGVGRTDDQRTIPASDRDVSITHNQFKEIDEPVSRLIEDLERDNGLPDEPGLKEKALGQIRAGRELLRAGEFRLFIFQATMLDGLRILSAKYGDHAIGAAASALLTLILHVLGLPGF